MRAASAPQFYKTARYAGRMAILEVDDGDDESPPPVPEGLQAAGLAMWEAVTGPEGWVLDDASLLILESCCRARDLEARLQSAVDASAKLRCRGSRDNQVELPELGSLVKVRAQVVSLWEKLGLERDDADGEADLFGDDATSARARKAARARWDRRFDLA